MILDPESIYKSKILSYLVKIGIYDDPKPGTPRLSIGHPLFEIPLKKYAFEKES